MAVHHYLGGFATNRKHALTVRQLYDVTVSDSDRFKSYVVLPYNSLIEYNSHDALASKRRLDASKHKSAPIEKQPSYQVIKKKRWYLRGSTPLAAVLKTCAESRRSCNLRSNDQLVVKMVMIELLQLQCI